MAKRAPAARKSRLAAYCCSARYVYSGASEDGNGLWCTQEKVGEVRRVRWEQYPHTGGTFASLMGAKRLDSAHRRRYGRRTTGNAESDLADVAEGGHRDADIGTKGVFKSKVTLAECRAGGKDVITEQDVLDR